MLKDAKKILRRAKKDKKAIGAFNVSSIEALQAVFKAAACVEGEVIIETSRGESEHLLPELLAAMCLKLSETYGVDYALHLDRGQDIGWIKRCLDAGFNSITAESLRPDEQMDTKKAVRIKNLADRYNAQVEGALEVVPLRYYKNKIQERLQITNPKQAKKFVQETGVDSLVLSIGTQSGRYKTVNHIEYDVLKEANKLLPDTPFVLHGGSFLPVEVYRECISNGIAKININSELRLAYTNTLKENIKVAPGEYAPYRLLNGARLAMEEIVVEKIKIFNGLI